MYRLLVDVISCCFKAALAFRRMYSTSHVLDNMEICFVAVWKLIDTRSSQISLLRTPSHFQPLRRGEVLSIRRMLSPTYSGLGHNGGKEC